MQHSDLHHQDQNTPLGGFHNVGKKYTFPISSGPLVASSRANRNSALRDTDLEPSPFCSAAMPALNLAQPTAAAGSESSFTSYQHTSHVAAISLGTPVPADEFTYPTAPSGVPVPLDPAVNLDTAVSLDDLFAFAAPVALAVPAVQPEDLLPFSYPDGPVASTIPQGDLLPYSDRPAASAVPQGDLLPYDRNLLPYNGNLLPYNGDLLPYDGNLLLDGNLLPHSYHDGCAASAIPPTFTYPIAPTTSAAGLDAPVTLNDLLVFAHLLEFSRSTSPAATAPAAAVVGFDNYINGLSFSIEDVEVAASAVGEARQDDTNSAYTSAENYIIYNPAIDFINLTN